jgi:hypothetical protein
VQEVRTKSAREADSRIQAGGGEMKFKRRPEAIFAVKWEGEITDEISKIIGGFNFSYNPINSVLFVHPTANPSAPVVHRGQWLVREAGNLSVLDDWEVRDRYEEYK